MILLAYNRTGIFDPSSPVLLAAHKLIDASKSDRLKLSPEKLIWISTIEHMIVKENFLDTQFNLARRHAEFFGVKSFRPQNIHAMFSVDGRSLRCSCEKNHARFAMSHPLKTGKWYYECQLLTDSSVVYLGWCTKLYRFSLEPKLLGECDGSWCYNLLKHTLLHNNSAPNAQPEKYATHVTWAAGGIVQIYLDCDAKQMAFGYDGKFLGLAFKEFEMDEHGLYPACLIDSENELRFNFSPDDFKFGPDESWKTDCKPYSAVVTGHKKKT